MRIKLLILIIIISIAFWVSLSCDKSSESQINEKPSLVSPFPDEEAEIMTLWYCHEAEADTLIYIRFRDNLSLLRDIYGDSIPEVNITFCLSFDVHQIEANMTDSAVAEIRADNYFEWDILNIRFDVDSVDTNFSHDFPKRVTLYFGKRVHTKIVSGYYEQLTGVINAYPKIEFTGDWPNIFPWINNSNRVTFLARNAWGDCPAGCIYSHFFYFREAGTGIEFIGDWNTQTDGDTEPEWWPEARAAIERWNNRL